MAMDKPLIRVMAGLIPRGVSLEAAEVVYINNLRWAAVEASKLGVRLTVEAINPVDMPITCCLTRRNRYAYLRRSAPITYGCSSIFFIAKSMMVMLWSSLSS